MGVRPRLSIRCLMIVVAVAALALGGWNEWHYRGQRDLWASRLGFCRSFARIHEQVRESCLQNKQNRVPNDTTRDGWCEGGPWKHIGSPHPYKGWSEEAVDNAVAASELRKMAEHAATMKRDAEKHLIFP
jgi:hypothetical protein